MTWRVVQGDVRDVLPSLPDQSVHCCITSPPYWGLRDYGVDGQIGQEPTPEAYVATLVHVFREVRRVLRDDATLWLNLGDSYSNIGKWGGRSSGKHAKALHGAHQTSSRVHGGKIEGLKPKDLVGIPWMTAFALRADGWYLRQDIVWAKPNPMPESVTDRCTKAHEYLFLLSKSPKYFYDANAVAEPASENKPWGANSNGGAKVSSNADRNDGGSAGLGKAADGTRNRRSVWSVSTSPYAEAHFATFPPKLIEPCILAGCPLGGTVLDPFSGSGTTGMVALRHQRHYLGVELNAEYVEMSRRRITDDQPLLNVEAAS